MFYFTLAQAHPHNAPPPKHPKDGNSALSVMTDLQPTLMQLNIRKNYKSDATKSLPLRRVNHISFFIYISSFVSSINKYYTFGKIKCTYKLRLYHYLSCFVYKSKTISNANLS